MRMENSYYLIEVDESNGAITAFVMKTGKRDWIGEKRLASNFRLCLPADNCMANYADGAAQTPVSITCEGDAIRVQYSGIAADLGNADIDLVCTFRFVDDYVSFRATLTNRGDLPVSEFWFPRFGGIVDFNGSRDAVLSIPGYTSLQEERPFRQFPGSRGLGADAAEFNKDYPGMVMPWWELYDSAEDVGLYMGYHDETFRYSTWHCYLFPNVARRDRTWLTEDEACGDPVGMVVSHVRYPYINKGEMYDTGEFIIRAHQGDWHEGSLFYRDWFTSRFPFDKTNSWLRKQSSWFTSILYQPEDKIIADYEGYDRWCKDAESYGIDCHELIGWDQGGLERDYPAYVPEDKLGGREGFRKLLASIDQRDKKCLVFVNYNILDSCTDAYKEQLHLYKHHDMFGNTPNWMAWGESTLLARKNINARRHHLSSIIKPVTDLLEDHFLQLVKDGAQGFQIDKLCVGSTLDFNPLNDSKPDVALCENLIAAIARLASKCKELDPEFCMAAEAVQDRLIPYFDVYYRNSMGCTISPLRYVFPEWTSCQHVNVPYEFNTVNGAILTGSVICVEPDMYQGTLDHPLWRKMGDYIREVERIRKRFMEVIFTGKYHDTMGATIAWFDPVEERRSDRPSTFVGGEVMIPGGGEAPAANPAGNALIYAVHGTRGDERRAIVVVNESNSAKSYTWTFTHKRVETVEVHIPFQPVRIAEAGETIEIAAEGLHILVERP